jgi:hypothetical protein
MLEYLWAAAWCFHARDDPAAEDWVAIQALAVLAGMRALPDLAERATAEEQHPRPEHFGARGILDV